MMEEIKFKAPNRRIDYLLGCLSGVIQSPYSKIAILDALYKEVDHEINPDERKHLLNLFNTANDRNNMFYRMEGWSRERIYIHKEEYLNEIELYLRALLGKYKHYAIQMEKVDYQLGEE